MPTIKLTASGYTGMTGMSVSNSYPMTRAYEDSADTSDYARCSLSASKTGYVYLTYDTSDIPANAIIQSVTANARLRISSSSRVTNRVCQLYSGTTAKGTGVSFSSTSSGGAVVSPTAGSWTRSELSDLRMRIGGTGSSSSQSKYIYIYGTDITITYTVPSVVSVTGVTLDKSTDTIAVGSTTSLTETVSPSNATDKTVSWSTSDSSVATVSNGVVTGVSAGTAIITVTTIDGGYTDTCEVAVISGGGQTWTTLYEGTIGVYPDTPQGQYIWIEPYTTPLESGQTYRVTWGNDTYICQTEATSIQCYDGYAIGNPDLWTQTTSDTEPFFLLRYSSTVLYGPTTSPTGTVYVKIELLTGGSLPVITVGTPSRSMISDETGYDQCVCTFQSNVDLQAWEARATKSGITPARGVGLLVESGTTLAANTNATIYVDDEELTQGDGEYTITVYGQSTGGVWSG